MSKLNLESNTGLEHSTLNSQTKMKCLICNSEDQKVLYDGIKDFEYETYKPVDYFKCNNCSLIYQFPIPRPEELKDFYPEEYRNYLPIQKSFFSFLKKAQFKDLANKIINALNKNNKDEKILDIGFGNGQLLTALKQIGYKDLYGSDFTDKTFSNLKNTGISLKVCNLEEDFPFDKTFDLIIMNNVIEHFINPLKVLESCKKHLSENGKIILITPNSHALEFSFFKRYWAGFHAPRHTFLFNPGNISNLAQKLGFSNVIVKPMTDPGQISISVQNFFQDTSFTKLKLKNGMAWYLMPLSVFCSPFAMFQNLLRRSTSMMCVLELGS